MADAPGAYASRTSDGGIALYGTADSLTGLASLVRSGGVASLRSPPLDVIEAAALEVLRVVPGDGPVVLRLVGETIEVDGGAEARGKLAESMENLAAEAAFGGVVARHIDVEYFEGHGFLGEASAWMTVTLLAALDQ